MAKEKRTYPVFQLRLSGVPCIKVRELSRAWKVVDNEAVKRLALMGMASIPLSSHEGVCKLADRLKAKFAVAVSVFMATVFEDDLSIAERLQILTDRFQPSPEETAVDHELHPGGRPVGPA